MTARQRVLTAWWEQIQGTPDARDLFARPPQSFAEFSARLDGRPLYAHYAETEAGTLALGPIVWGIPLARGLVIGLWIPPGQRRRKTSLARIEELLGMAFREYPVLLAAAETPARERLYLRYGFVGMTFPRLGEDGDIWLGWLTPETWRRRLGG